MAAGLALVGPVSLDALRDLIPPQAWREDIPRDIGATVLPSLARAFLERGLRVTIVSYAIGLEREAIIDAGPLRLCIGPGRHRGRARDFFAAERHYLAETLRREQPSLLHAHWTYEFAMAAQSVSQASRLPCLITAHDAPLSILRHNPTPYRFMRTLMAYRVLHAARMLVAVSPHVERHLRHWFGFHGDCTVIPNGIDERIFRIGQARRQNPQKPGCVFACVMNGWGRLKNPTTLLLAFARLRSALPQSRLLMIGDGYGPDGPAAAWAASHQATDGVDFIGPWPHAALLDRLHGTADIFVHPSREEAQGLSVLEAMALGIPVIGGAQSGALPWVLNQGQAGLLADISTPAALADAMLSLAQNPQKQQSLAAKGFEYARRQFGMQAVADRHAEIYTRLCGAAWQQS